jgi:hypothetical protein
MNVGKTLFAQVVEYVPWKTFGRIVERHGGDVGVRTLSCTDLFRVLVFSQLTWRESLRDIEACLAANQSKLFHMGLRSVPARSTLSDALNGRDWRIYHALAMRLIARARSLYASDSLGIELDATVYALDSTTLDLCMSLFDWAQCSATRAAVKMHTLLDLRGALPAFVHVSDGRLGDVSMLDVIPIEAGAFYVMDRGYVDFTRLYKMHQTGAFFVTRAKSNLLARRVYSSKVERATGVICDQSISLKGVLSGPRYPELLRRVRFQDPQSIKTLVFLTNNTSLPPLTIAALYKSRWQIELFFKWIKQHLRIKRFLGTSENAVKTQIWCAMSTYLLIAIIKKELRLEATLYTLLQILSVSVFEKTELSRALQPDNFSTARPVDPNQLSLFEI